MKNLTTTLVAVAAVVVVGLLVAQEKRETPSPATVGGADQGREFRMPPLEVQEIRKQEPIRIEGYELETIAEGSVAGQPGDLLLTFIGRGFVLTSLGPRVSFGDKLVIESAEVNRGGTELYLVLTRRAFDEVARQHFDTALVENPGGLEDGPYARASIPITPDELIDRQTKAEKVVLIYHDSFYERRHPEGESRR